MTYKKGEARKIHRINELPDIGEKNHSARKAAKPFLY
jgi:hypothetical protein